MAENRFRGQLAVPTRIEVTGHAGAKPGALVDTGLDTAAKAIAGEFSAFGNKVGAWADKAAAIEGAREGHQAGMDPEFRPRREPTIRDQAYDRAGLDVAQSRIRTEITAQLQGLGDKYKGNPAGFAKAAGEARAGWLAQVPQELHPEVAHRFRSAELAFNRQAAREAAARAAAEQKAATSTEIAEGLKELHQRAYLLGIDPTADDVLAKDVQLIEGALKRVGPNGQPLYTPGQIAELKAKTRQEVASARILGAFERMNSLTGKRAFIQSIEEDWKRSKGIAKTFDLDGFRSITAKLEAGLRKDEIEERRKLAGVQHGITAVTRLAEKGFAPPPDQMAALRAQVGEIADPRARAALSKAETLFAVQTLARAMPPTELAGEIAKTRAHLQKAGATPDQVAQLELLQKIHTEMSTTLKTDPWSWFARIGHPPAPIRWGQTVTEPGSGQSMDLGTVDLGQRIAQADAVSRAYGIEPPYWTADDKKMLAQVVTAGGAPLVQAAQSIAGAFGDKADEAFRQLGGKHASSGNVLAMLGGLVHEGASAGIVQDVANGLALRRVKEFKSLAPEVAKSQPVIERTFGRALATLPGTGEVLRNAANAVYDVRARREGWTVFDEQKYAEILSQLAGEVVAKDVAYGGVGNHRAGWFDGQSQRMVLVPPGVARDRFDDAIGLITNADLEGTGQVPYAENGKRLSAEAVRRGVFVSAGSGRYRVALGDPGSSDPQWLLDKDGRPMTLDFRALIPRLRERAPSLFLGGR